MSAAMQLTAGRNLCPAASQPQSRQHQPRCGRTQLLVTLGRGAVLDRPTQRRKAKSSPLFPHLFAPKARPAAQPATVKPKADFESGHLDWPSNLTDRYRVGRTLGRGAFGTIKLARSKSTGETVAIKVLSKSRPGQSRSRTAGKLMREADCLAAVQECHGVVQLKGLFECNSSAYLVLEHCNGGDLEQLVQGGGALSEHQTAVVLFEVLQVVAACHRRGVCHGDIKPANFLLSKRLPQPLHALTAGERPPDAGWLKAIDFGCAQQISGNKPLSRRTGTPVYMAPEVFVRRYSRPADMWSVGMLLYHLLSARFPFWDSMDQCKASSLEEVMEAVTNGAITMDYGPFLSLSPEGCSLLEGLLIRDPEKRLSAEAALRHDFFKLHLGWEAEAPFLTQSVLPQLVATWADPSDKAAAAAATIARTMPETAAAAAVYNADSQVSVAASGTVLVKEGPQQRSVAKAAASGTQRKVRSVRRSVSAEPKPVVANNVVPVNGHRAASAGVGKKAAAPKRSAVAAYAVPQARDGCGSSCSAICSGA